MARYLSYSHAVKHLGKGCTNLTIAQILRQRLVPRHQSQRLHAAIQ